jgi:hypothetical protein
MGKTIFRRCSVTSEMGFLGHGYLHSISGTGKTSMSESPAPGIVATAEAICSIVLQSITNTIDL